MESSSLSWPKEPGLHAVLKKISTAAMNAGTGCKKLYLGFDICIRDRITHFW